MNGIFAIANGSMKNSGLQQALSYEATDVRRWSFVGSNEPMRKAGMNDEIIYEI